MAALRVTLALLFAIGISSCSDQSQPSARPDPQPSAPDLVKVRAQAERDYPKVPLLKGVPAPPVTGGCADEMCVVNQVQFQQQDWPKAWRGDYQAQRNVAFCLKDSCNGAVQINVGAACAWRSIIAESHVDESDDTDVANLEAACGNLSAAARMAALKKAQSWISRIKS